MLLRFIITNYRSFRESTEFNLFPGSFKIHKHRVHHGEVDLLKAGAIYGANASGKSNFIKAIYKLNELICFEDNEKFQSHHLCFKGDDTAKKEPIEFEIEFKAGSHYYSYGLHLLDNYICSEWLIQLDVKNPEKDEVLLERESNADGVTKFTPGPRFAKNDEIRTLFKLYAEDIIKPHEPFLKVLKERSEKNQQLDDFLRAYYWFEKQLIMIRPRWRFASLAATLYNEPAFKQFTCDLIRNLDLGIQDISFKSYSFDTFFSVDEDELREDIETELQKTPDAIIRFAGGDTIAVLEDEKFLAKTLEFRHSNTEKALFDFSEESDGTRRIFDFLPVIYQLLKEEIVLIIDEMEQSIHPSLIKALLKKVLNDKNLKGQIIFTTHESHLLDLKLFRQDEVWFAEKDKRGYSTLYALSEFKPRHDLDLQKGYLNGRFNAIPFLGNLEDLNWAKPLEIEADGGEKSE